MNAGMLWFDNSKNDLKTKVIEAATYYKKKYGDSPTLCFVHPEMLGEKEEDAKAGKVEIRPDSSILLHHIWIGVRGN